MSPRHTTTAATVALALTCFVLLPTAPARADGLHFGGSLETHLQFGLTGCGGGAGGCRFHDLRNTNVLGLTLEARFGDAAEVTADVRLRNVNFTEVETLGELGDISAVQPVSLRVRDAHVTLYDLLPGVDLSAGAMRFVWGEAEGYDPVDRLNPWDLEDPTRFDRRLATPAVAIGVTLGPVHIEAVGLPLFVPGVLPTGSLDVTSLGAPTEAFDLSSLGWPSPQGGQPPAIGHVEMPLTTPSPSLENISAAARLVWDSPIGRLGLLWYRGFDSLPQASGEARLSSLQSVDRIELTAPLVFPKIQTLAATWRGQIAGGLYAWVEAVAIFPEQTALVADRVQLEQLQSLSIIDAVPTRLPRVSTQGSTPYPNVVVGLEYAFDDGPIVNIQYLYGLMTERSAGDQHHYALLGMRWPLLDGRLVLDARAGLEIADTSMDGLGWLAGGGVAWLHGDAVEVRLGATFLDGGPNTSLRAFRDVSNLQLRFTVKF